MDTTGSPEDLFRENSRSFSLAARFFCPEDQSAVARLYRFCRYLDDLADDTATGDPLRLEQAKERLLTPDESPADTIEADFNALAVERSIPIEPALDLIDALRADCGERTIQDETELIRFAYGVAGTVGQMMRPVIGARDPRADAFAIDLGIALQLSNVIRDVAEDAHRGRYYLPATWVGSGKIDDALAGSKEACREVDRAVSRAFDWADTYYKSAFRGFAYIPKRNRRVIYLATAFYRAIGQKVVSRSPGGWSARTVVSPFEKLTILLRSPLRYRCLQRRLWQRDPEPEHDAALHEPLASGSRQDLFSKTMKTV